jgi:CRP-like cAMP-binding protein
MRHAGRSVSTSEGGVVVKHQDPVIDQLRQVSLFSACTPQELELIAGRTTRLEFEPGDVLAKEGALGREFLVLVDGEATVRVGDREVATLGPGEFFGEVALLDDGPRTATVTAKTHVVAEVLSQSEFSSLLLDAPRLMKNLLVVVAHRLRAADLQLHG